MENQNIIYVEPCISISFLFINYNLFKIGRTWSRVVFSTVILFCYLYATVDFVQILGSLIATFKANVPTADFAKIIMHALRSL